MTKTTREIEKEKKVTFWDLSYNLKCLVIWACIIWSVMVIAGIYIIIDFLRSLS